MKTKLCRGPLHPPGGSYIPLDEYTINKSGPRAGKPLSRCKYCRSSGEASTIPLSVVIPLLETLLENYNLAEISKITNLNRQLLKDIRTGKRRRVYKKTFLKIHRAASAIPKNKTSIGPKRETSKRNGLKKLSYEERLGLRRLVSAAQKERFKKDKQLLKHVV